jgi:hypothetical protein
MRELTDFEQKLIVAGLSYFGAITSIFIGSWLVGHRDLREKRRGHRRTLRSTQTTYISRDRAWETVQSLQQWWITAIEDYGPILRWRIPRKIADLNAITFPHPDWDEQCETSYHAASEESKQRYSNECSACRKKFLGILNSIIRIA